MQVQGFSARLRPDQGHYLEIPKGISTGNKLVAGSGERTDGRAPASLREIGSRQHGVVSARVTFVFPKCLPPLRGHRVTKHRAMINTWPRSAVTGHCLSYSPTSCVTLGKGFPSLDLCFSI